MESITLDSSDFESFLRCLGTLKDICNDVDIRGGFIRQRTNDNSAIFEINLTSLLGEIDIPIVSLKQKLDLFRSFEDQDVELSIVDDSFSFSDQFSKLTIQKPELDFFDNKFMTEEELNEIFVMDELEVIISYDISNIISERMRVMCQAFNVNMLRVKFNGDYAEISSTNQSRDLHVDFLKDIPVETPLSCHSNLFITPFIVDHDGEIKFRMHSGDKDNVCINKFSTSLDDIDLTIFSRATLEEEEGEEE